MDKKKLHFLRILTAGFLGVIFYGGVLPQASHGELYLHFLVDRSGSMWAPYQGKPKILHISEAIERIGRQLPDEVVIGLRVYPTRFLQAVPGQTDVGLRAPLKKENRQRLINELSRLNPQGKTTLSEPLIKAIRDFPEGTDTKLLILICDGADTKGVSFCDRSLMTSFPEGLRFLVVSLNLKDKSEQEDLDCLSDQFSGRTIHLASRGDLFNSLLPICKKAYQDELERQKRVLAERRRLEELMSKTRLKAEFHNSLDPFFGDSIEIVKCRVDEEDIPFEAALNIKTGETSLLFDKAVKKGEHRVCLQYKKWRGGKAIFSEEAFIDVQVKEGKTAHILVVPRGKLFRWDCAFKPLSP